MGMFDDIRCKYPLPLAGANDLEYQTKDTDAQFLDMYEIRKNGTLWHEVYDTEDRSELGKWERENPGKEPPEELRGLSGFAGFMTRVNKKWDRTRFTGEIRFYAVYALKDGKLINSSKGDSWIEWSAYFVEGKLKELHLITNKKLDDPSPAGHSTKNTT